MPSAAPRRLSAEDRREQIMQAAAQLFIERGFEGVGMADIAAALQVSRPTIYNYFPSTEEILDELFAQLLQHFDRQVAPLLQQEGRTIADVFELIVRERELLLLLGSGGGPLFRKRRQAFLSAIEDRLQSHSPTSGPILKASRQHLPQLMPIVVNLLLALAYEQVTQRAQPDMAAVLERFVLGGTQVLAEG